MTQPDFTRERTVSAWARTALGAAGFGIALVRLGLTRGTSIEVTAGIVSMLVGVMLALAGRTANRRSTGRPSVTTMRAATMSVAAIGVLAVVVALMS